MSPFLTAAFDDADVVVEEEEEDEEEEARLAHMFLGPQIRTVESSETEASNWGYLGFQETQLTERQCPLKTAIGVSHLIL